MKTKDQRILSFILDEHPDIVSNFVAKNPIPCCVQDELLDNYPETFRRIVSHLEIEESIMLKMITSKKKMWIPVIMTKHLNFKEQVIFVRNHPEKVKEYQDFLIKNADGLHDSLCPSAEEEYFKIRQKRPDLPEIKYFWHPELKSDKEIFNDEDYVDVI